MKALVSKAVRERKKREVLKTKLMAFLKNMKLIFGCRSKTRKK